MSFSCIANGSFHQGDSRFSNESNNAQCMANSACALAWQFLGGEFNSLSIDRIFLTGDQIYLKSRQENSVNDRYLFPEDLTREFHVMSHTLDLSVQFVCNGLYPATTCDLQNSLNSLSNVLQTILSEDTVTGGFLFTGQLTTVAFWRRQGRLYVFDSHAVNEKRQHDHDINNNLARVFVCGSFPALASLLMCNAAMDGTVREFNITEVTFGIVNEPVGPTTIDGPYHSVEHDPQLNIHKPVDILSSLKQKPVSYSDNDKKGRGRPVKIKRGRPKTLDTTREEQVKEAKKRYNKSHPEKNRKDVKQYTERHPDVNRTAVEHYSQQHPEINRAAVERYSQQHPEVHREAVQRYTQRHPEVHREAVRQYDQRHPEASVQRVQIFRLKNPKLSELRHLSSSLARDVVKDGPMASWRGDLLDKITSFKLSLG